MSRVAMLLSLAILGSAALCAGQAAIATGPMPNPLSISLDQATQEAAVTESTGSEIQFTGKVSVQMIIGQRVTVTLTPSVDCGWASDISPSEMLFTSDGPQPFIVNITVPESTASAMVGMLVVDARCTEVGMAFTAEATANITVRPYFRIMIESKEPNVEIAPGGTARVTVNVWNVGNSADSFDLGVVELERLTRDGWEVRLDPNELSAIPVGNYREVNITARSPQDRDLTLYRSEPVAITLKGASRGASGRGETVTQSYSVYVYVKGADMQAVGVLSGGIAAVVIIIAVIVIAVLVRRRRMKRRQSAPEKK